MNNMNNRIDQTKNRKPNHTAIYAAQAATYDQLISKQSSLLLYDQLCDIIDFTGKDIVDLGAGTGRISSMLASTAPSIPRSIVALDKSTAMLDLAKSKLGSSPLRQWSIQQADHRNLPLPDQCADIVISGWSISYLTNTGQENWEQNLHSILQESKRVLRPNGVLIILETLGTGCTSPAPPDYLRPYFAMLESSSLGFQHTSFRLDYHFESVEQAITLADFFFGETVVRTVQQNQSCILPECAGVWWRYFD